MIQKLNSNFRGSIILPLCFLLWIITTDLSAQTAKTSPSPQGLPLLEVTFPGEFYRYMDYVKGTMKLTDLDGSVVEMSAKFKTRGATAQQYLMKPSFNMKLRGADGEETDSTLLGLRSCSSWILDAMAIDRICMRNRVGFDTWNEFSKLPYETNFDSRNGTVGRFVEVYINGSYKGIYCLTDRINRKLLDLKKVKIAEEGPDTIRGVLYKQGTEDIIPQNEYSFSADSGACVVGWHNAWELAYPDDHGCIDAWTPLIEAVNHSGSYDYVKSHYYLENLADLTIFTLAFSIVDNWGNKNKYASIRNIRADGNKARIVLTPWDLDTSLGGSYNGANYGGNYVEWLITDAMKNAPDPIGICLGQTEFKDLLVQRWKEGRLGALSVESVSQKLRSYQNQFQTSGAWQRQWSNFKPDEVMLVEDLPSEIDQIIQWYRQRFNEMDEYFGIDPSAIDEIAMSPESIDQKAESSIYDLSGRLLGTLESQNLSNLPQGLYIINGKKYLLRDKK